MYGRVLGLVCSVICLAILVYLELYQLEKRLEQAHLFLPPFGAPAGLAKSLGGKEIQQQTTTEAAVTCQARLSP